jgi:hypothetical protein
MFELASTTVFLLIICLFVGFFSKFLHYCIGEPRHGQEGAEFAAGRIFSFYGRWVMMNYQKAYDKETKRINAMYREEGRRTNGNISELKEFEISSKFRGSVWMPLGACNVCFSTWISLICFLIILPSFGLSIFWLSLCVPTSTIISGKLYL